MVDEGYAATQILIQLHESITEGDLNDKQKSAITEKMAASDVIHYIKEWFHFWLFMKSLQILGEPFTWSAHLTLSLLWFRSWESACQTAPTSTCRC